MLNVYPDNYRELTTAWAERTLTIVECIFTISQEEVQEKLAANRVRGASAEDVTICEKSAILRRALQCGRYSLSAKTSCITFGGCGVLHKECSSCHFSTSYFVYGWLRMG